MQILVNGGTFRIYTFNSRIPVVQQLPKKYIYQRKPEAMNVRMIEQLDNEKRSDEITVEYLMIIKKMMQA